MSPLKKRIGGWGEANAKKSFKEKMSPRTMIKNDVRGRQISISGVEKNFHRAPKNLTQTLCFPNGPSVRRHYVGLLKLTASA